jgi:glucose/mannose-6-phosphate isomerase
MTESAAGSGGILDDVGAMRRADPDGMLALAAALPSHLLDAWRISRDLQLPWPTPRNVALLGMGGSAIAGDLAAAIWADRLSVPLAVVRSDVLPAWVGQETLVVASSRSGATEETIAALTTALARRCPVVVVTGGGPLRGVAERARLPLAAIPPVRAPAVSAPAAGVPAATSGRAVVGYSLGLLAGILERAGVLALDEAEVTAAAGDARAMAARCAADVPTAGNPAKQLAWSLVDRMAIIMAGGVLAPVGLRWKMQLNETTKALAAFEALPEAIHGSIVGLEQPEALHDHLFAILLGSPDDAVGSRRARLLGELLGTAGIAHTSVEASGRGPLGQATSSLVLGDHAAVYAAFTYAVDPGPVLAVEHLRRRLAELTQEAGT